jgi:uncharacterized membrane protein
VTGADLAATEARIRAFEARTGVEAVAAVVDRSDRYHGLRWRAFAAGASLAALGVVVADFLRPDWTGAHAALVTAVAILAEGLGAALLATLSRPFERLFLQRERAEGEARQRARALFLERELFRDAGPNPPCFFSRAVTSASPSSWATVATTGASLRGMGGTSSRQ